MHKKALKRCFENFILIMSNMTLISQTNSRHAGDIKEEAKELQNEDEVGTVEIKSHLRPKMNKGVRINPGQIFWQGRYVDQTMFYKELVGSSTHERNWKGIVIAIAVILFVLFGVAISVILMTPPDTGPRVKGERFTIRSILDKKYMPRKFNGTWISDNELLLKDFQGGLSIYNVESSHKIEIVPGNLLRRFQVSKYSLSPSRKFVLLTHKLDKRFSFSSWAYFFIYEISSGLIWDLSLRSDADAEDQNNNFRRHLSDPAKLLYATWLPCLGEESPIIFVENFTVYYMDDVGQQSSKVRPISIPENVIPEVIINGIPDWIYEEEILRKDNAIWISQDGKKLVYATFNDSLVEEVKLKTYGSPIGSVINPYPKETSFRYPKAGSKNPTFCLWLVNLTSMEQERIHPPYIFKDIDHYFTDVSWVDLKSVSVTWLNRFQNISLVTHCKAPTWICKEAYREEIGSLAFPAPLGHSSTKYSKNGSFFLTMANLRDEEDLGYFRQIVLLDTTHGNLVHQITIGKFEVDQILAWNEYSGTIFFLAIPQISPFEKHLFKISDKWQSGPQVPECLSCLLSTEVDRKCFYTGATFSLNNSHFILECLGPDVPSIYLFNLNSELSFELLDDNQETFEFVSKMAWPKTQKIIIRLPGENRKAMGKLYLPQELSPDETTTYPMIVHVAGRPRSQLVIDTWKMDFLTYLSSGLSFIVLEIDGCGSGGQGENKVAEVKDKLGKMDVKDQLDATRFVLENFPFIDSEKIAVFGSGYGGYIAGLMLANHNQDFLHLGVAISPIVDLRLYGSTFSEKYMGLPTPTGNYHGYQGSSLISLAKNIEGKGLLLIHGMADKKVPFQNSILLAKALADNNIPYEQHFYPDEDHNLSGVKSHLHTLIANFFQRYLLNKELINTNKTKKAHPAVVAVP